MLECIKLLLHNLKCKEYKWTHSHIWSVMLFEHTSVSIGLGQPWTPLFFHLSGGFYWCTICCSQYTRKQGLGLRGSIHPPTGPDHQISLTQITSKKKKNSLITKKFMYSESVDGCFHDALWSCRECYTCQVYRLIQSGTNHKFLQGPGYYSGPCLGQYLPIAPASLFKPTIAL